MVSFRVNYQNYTHKESLYIAETLIKPCVRMARCLMDKQVFIIAFRFHPTDEKHATYTRQWFSLQTNESADVSRLIVFLKFACSCYQNKTEED
jgi:hypothetical protein